MPRKAQPDGARKKLVLGACLVLATFVVYSPTLSHPFCDLDDPAYVTENPHVQGGLTLDNVGWAFTSFHASNWHPLTWISLQLDASLYTGQRAAGFHRTNVLLHALNAWLLFHVFAHMTGMVWRSIVLAGLFALHPLHVESVSWIAERKDVLSTCFWFLTIALYILHVRKPGPGRLLLVAVSFTLGLLAKPMVVTLPFVLLLLDYWPLRRWGRAPAVGVNILAESQPPPVSTSYLLAEKAPLFLLAALSCVVTYIAQGRAVQSFAKFPLDIRLANGLIAYVAYLQKTFWPTDLAIYYPHPGLALSYLGAALAGVCLAAVTMVVLWPGRRLPYLSAGWLWYLGTLVPVIGIVQLADQAYADRYTYIPVVGIFLMVTWGLADLLEALRLPRWLPGTLAGLVLLIFTFLTVAQESVWADEISLWSHAVHAAGDNEKSLLNLGTALAKQNRTEEAIDAFQRVHTLDPKAIPPIQNLGVMYQRQGRLDEAIDQFQKALAISPSSPQLRYTLGTLLRDQGRVEEGIGEARKAIAEDPKSAFAHLLLGMLLMDKGEHREAVAEYREAIKLDPTREEAYAALVQLFLEQGEFAAADESIRAYVGALPPGDPRGRSVQGALNRSRRLQALDRRLPEYMQGKTAPASLRERVDIGWLCQLPKTQRYGAAVRFYADAFKEEPRLADDIRSQHRYQAACAAARAGVGEGADASNLSASEKARFRNQALEWLNADLVLWARLATADAPARRNLAGRFLRLQKLDKSLAGVRDAGALVRLPEVEKQAWQKYWSDVDAAIAASQARVVRH